MFTRRLLSAFGVVLTIAAVSLASVTPAQAWEQREIFKTGWAYTDSRLPRQSFVNPAGDAPIGARTASDGKHKSRSYFTFDVSRFSATVVHNATLVIRERSAADCAEAQRVELWQTDPIKPTTSWESPPRPRELIGTVLAGGESTCPGWLTWDIRPLLQRLANRNESVLTVMIRVPYREEGDITHGRVLVPSPSIQVTSNHAPTVARIGAEWPSWVCGTRRDPQPVGARSYGMQVQINDADQFDWDLRGHFAAWPVDHPEQRSEQPGAVYGTGFSKTEWEMGQYPHGTVVAWNVRAFDGHDYSQWTRPCYVKVDAEPPAAPVVTSAKYPDDGEPHGGEGVPGTFVFKANGSADVVGYYWGRFGDAYNYLPAPAPGADATLEYTPTSFSESLSVRSVDAAGLQSEITHYRFFVKTTAPGARVTMAGIGLPSRLRMFTDEEGVTEFGYRIDDAAEVRVPVGADGSAEVPIVFTELGNKKLVVRSYAGSELIGAATFDVRVEDSPTVESADFAWPDRDGVVDRPGSFTFRPRRTEVVAYEYRFQSDEAQRVDAGADGTAVLRWTPTRPDSYTLRVRSISADGTQSEWASYDFNVIDNKPTVYSSTYYDSGAWGGVGIPGEFSFDTAMPDVDAYAYRLNDEPEQTVDAEYGSARVTLAPPHSGRNVLTVRTRYLDGSFSPPKEYVFEVSDAPVVVSTDYPENASGGQPGQSGRFTFNPGRDGIVEYRYSLEWGEQQTVAAGPDGRATVELTPTHAGYTTLMVSSVTADGTVTPERWYSFFVRDPRVWVNSRYFSQYTPRGGIGWEGRFGLRTELSEVTTYEYKLNDGAWQSVPRSTEAYETEIAVTMERNGENVLSVRGRTAAGQYTPQTDEPFLVGTAPLVTSATYPAGGWSGGVGVPGTFTFTQGTPGVVEFEYRIDGGEPVLVPAEGGVATPTYTPAASGWQTMTVRGRKADDTWTDPASYSFGVS